MKRVVFIIVAAVLAANSVQAQFTFGVRAGLNLTNFSLKINEKKRDGDLGPKFKQGFQIGVVGELALSDNFAIQPGLLVATQGCKYKYSSGTGSLKSEYKATTNLNYLQIPINAQYKLDVGNMKLLLLAGPYFGFGLSGKAKWEAKYGSESDSGDEKAKFGKNRGEIKPLDFGLGLGAGLQFGNIQAGLGYNLGFANLYNKFDDGVLPDNITQKNYGLALTVTYLFGK